MSKSRDRFVKQFMADLAFAFFIARLTAGRCLFFEIDIVTGGLDDLSLAVVTFGTGQCFNAIFFAGRFLDDRESSGVVFGNLKVISFQLNRS